jgi:hypothetical protein
LRRRRPELKLALALQIGFLRMSGRLLEAVRIVPPLLWKHLGARFNVAAPDLASLRAMYGEREIPGGQAQDSASGLGRLFACLNLLYRPLRSINFA